MAVQVDTVWRPIEDLPEDWEKLAQEELRSLINVWREQREHLSPAGTQEFLARLQRRWAVETGVLERIYTLDRSITEILIERGIDASLIPSGSSGKPPEIVAAIINDQQAALEAIFDFVKGKRLLSTSYVKQLHALITRHQETSSARDQFGREVEVPLLRGDYKRQPNNPVRPDGSTHQYAPPEHVASEMDGLIAMHLRHEQEGVAPEVSAAWLHHRFTQIHPFQDGNGRVARSLATLVLIKAEYFPLTLTRDDRESYIGALEAADGGDLGPLVKLFAANQRRAFTEALSVASDLSRPRDVQQVIQSVRDELARRDGARRLEWDRAKEMARELQRRALERLEEVANQLETETRRYSPSWRFRADGAAHEAPKAHYFRHQVVDTAKQRDYFANTNTYQAWARLVLATEGQTQVLFSFHGVGHDFRGTVVVAACLFRREESEDGERVVSPTLPVGEGVFQINYKEPPDQIRARFKQWLDASLAEALGIWRAGI